MSKLKPITLRLNEEVIKTIEEAAKEELIDKTSMARKFIYKGVEAYQREKAVELYRKGEISLEKAASVCGVCVAEMVELLAKSGVHANITLEHYREGLKNLEKTLRK